jgi:hypothetical protein
MDGDKLKIAECQPKGGGFQPMKHRVAMYRHSGDLYIILVATHIGRTVFTKNIFLEEKFR